MKMKIFRLFTLLALAACLWPVADCHARGKQDDVYMFGYGQNFKDSTVYVTAIQLVEGAQIEKGSGFLTYRDDYSGQFKIFLADNLGVESATCSVFFAKKKSDVEKKLLKVRRRVRAGKENRLRELAPGEFVFNAPLIAPAQTMEGGR